MNRFQTDEPPPDVQGYELDDDGAAAPARPAGRGEAHRGNADVQGRARGAAERGRRRSAT